MNDQNKQVIIAAIPRGYPRPSDFQLNSTSIPTPKPGELLVKTHYLSVDPYQRGWMAQGNVGDLMTGGVVGSVETSLHPDFKPGDFVVAPIGWQEYGISNGKDVRRIHTDRFPISKFLGALGITGLSAYFGIMEIGIPKSGQTVVVSGAAGATGSIAGQIAKLHGCHTVGIAGSDKKVRALIDEFQFDAGFNYKTVTDYDKTLEELCQNGIDVYFDNVGGIITDAIFRHINRKSRIIICGQISQYNLESPDEGPRYLWPLIRTSSKVEGFVLSDFTDKFDEALLQLQDWLSRDLLVDREQVTDGIATAPSAFIDMLKGGNIGKQLVRITNQ